MENNVKTLLANSRDRFDNVQHGIYLTVLGIEVYETYPRKVLDLLSERLEEWMKRLIGVFGDKFRYVHRFDVV